MTWHGFGSHCPRVDKVSLLFPRGDFGRFLSHKLNLCTFLCFSNSHSRVLTSRLLLMDCTTRSHGFTTTLEKKRLWESKWETFSLCSDLAKWPQHHRNVCRCILRPHFWLSDTPWQILKETWKWCFQKIHPCQVSTSTEVCCSIKKCWARSAEVIQVCRKRKMQKKKRKTLERNKTK